MAIVANMYSTTKNSITLTIPVHVGNKTTVKTTLLDSGATQCFIDKHTVKKMGIQTIPLKHPVTVNNADGTENKNGSIMNYTTLYVRAAGKTQRYSFFVTNLGHD